MKILSKEEVNSNNGWGFGGMIGTITIFNNGLLHKKGRAYYRHTPSSKVDVWRAEAEEDFFVDVKGKLVDGSTVYVYSCKNSYTATTKQPVENKLRELFPYHDKTDPITLVKKIKVNKIPNH